MARITVEDCIDKFPSRFELVLVASNRARKLHSGETPTIDKDNDKNTVIALREIAQSALTIEQLKNDLVEEYQTTTFNDEEEELIESDENTDNNEFVDSELSYKNEQENDKDNSKNSDQESVEDSLENDQNSSENFENLKSEE